MPNVFISLGSNIDPEVNVRRAVGGLVRAIQVRGISTVYRTTPIGRPDQPAFYNAVVLADTHIPARQLKFDVLRRIEDSLGRIRTSDKYSPRTIDLDIILYDDQVIREEGLIIPDPDIYTRPFLAAGVFELAPELILPDTSQPVRDVANRLPTAGMQPLPAYTESLRSYIVQIACEIRHELP